MEARGSLSLNCSTISPEVEIFPPAGVARRNSFYLPDGLMWKHMAFAILVLGLTVTKRAVALPADSERALHERANRKN
jgi:hypothetical protein